MIASAVLLPPANGVAKVMFSVVACVSVCVSQFTGRSLCTALTPVPLCTGNTIAPGYVQTSSTWTSLYCNSTCSNLFTMWPILSTSGRLAFD